DNPSLHGMKPQTALRKAATDGIQHLTSFLLRPTVDDGWSGALARWCPGAPWPSPPFPASCPCRRHHHSVSSAPSSNRTGPFRSSGFPTVFTAWRAEAMHHRAMELVQPRLLEEGGRECPESLTTSFVLPPQEVHELGVDVGVHFLEMPVGVTHTAPRA